MAEDYAKLQRFKIGAQAQIATLHAEKEALEAAQKTWQAERAELLAKIAALESGGAVVTPTPVKKIRLRGDVRTDGLFDLPSQCAAEWKPISPAISMLAGSGSVPRNANVVSLCVLREEDAPSDAATVLVGCADKTVQAARWRREALTSSSAEASGTAFELLDTLSLDAPALCMSECPLISTSGRIIVAGLMNGKVVILRWDDTDKKLHVISTFALHSKYVTTVRMSGRYIATASHDRSLCILRINDFDSEVDALTPSVVQQLYFRGTVEALSWLDGTLVAAVRGMPVLYYITVYNPFSAEPVHVDIITAHELPVQMPHDVNERLFIHRVPLSEDGVHLSILQETDDVVDNIGFNATRNDAYPVPTTSTMPSTSESLLLSADEGAVDLDLSENGMYIPVGFNIYDIAATNIGEERLLAAAADNGVIYLFRWGTNELLHRLVGHNVSDSLQSRTRIAWHPSHSEYLTATSDRDFAMCMYSIGSGRVVCKLGVGQPPLSNKLTAAGDESSTIDDVTQVSRYGRNLSALSAGTDDAAATAVVAGHTGTIKDIAWVGPQLLFSCGFDKRVLVWTGK